MVNARDLNDDRWDWAAAQNIVGITLVYIREYGVYPCVDGYVYVMARNDESQVYRFNDYAEAKAFFAKIRTPDNEPLFDTEYPPKDGSGRAIAAQQLRVLHGLIDAAPVLGRNIPPPTPSSAKAAQENLRDIYNICRDDDP